MLSIQVETTLSDHPTIGSLHQCDQPITHQRRTHAGGWPQSAHHSGYTQARTCWSPCSSGAHSFRAFLLGYLTTSVMFGSFRG
jgi:hypothetical protein